MNIGFGTNKIVYVCSPLATGFKPGMKDEKGQEIIDLKTYININMEKATDYAGDVFKKGDIPNLLHSYLPKKVDDTIQNERKRAMEYCIATVKNSDALVYFDIPRGGMLEEIKTAIREGIPVMSGEKYSRLSSDEFDTIVENTERYKKRKALNSTI